MVVLFIFLNSTTLFSIDFNNNIGYENIHKQGSFFDSFEDEFNESEQKVSDPFSGYNRLMTGFNDKFYIYLAIPAAKGYKNVVPEEARTGISNFFHNLLFPVRFVNNVLQFKFQNSMDELSRFIINSTFGLLGFMDPAKHHFGIEPKNEDLGQTLGHWGIGSGPHIVLPFLGPSNLRDMFGLVGDSYITPISNNAQEDIRIPNSGEETIALRAYSALNEISHNPELYESIKKDSIDLYTFLRDTYEQRRQKLIEE
ncbi:VacJ family lipoprotein [Arcobacter sp. FWKO B]|nr:VacJ family lipoprotein [Arcobacter sp. FWKO B]